MRNTVFKHTGTNNTSSCSLNETASKFKTEAKIPSGSNVLKQELKIK